MIVIIFGPPGSGKGTQSSLLIAKYNNFKLISVGDLLRTIISSRSKLAEGIKETIESGNLIQDDIICKLLCDQLVVIDGDFLLDGFPRNLSQAHFLTQVLQKRFDKDVDLVIELQLDDNISIFRLKDRLTCLDCKNVYSISSLKKVICSRCKSRRLEKRIDDANMLAISRRIREYHFQMKNLREYYSGKLLTINASLSIDRVMQEIESKMLVI